ncbi:MAG: hypothetical protein AAFV53_20825 [Myxococcota bacterium]
MYPHRISCVLFAWVALVACNQKPSSRIEIEPGIIHMQPHPEEMEQIEERINEEQARAGAVDVSPMFSCVGMVELPQDALRVFHDAEDLESFLAEVGNQTCGDLGAQIDFDAKTLVAYTAAATCSLEEEQEARLSATGELTVLTRQTSVGTCERMAMKNVWLVVNDIPDNAKTTLYIVRLEKDGRGDR